MYKMDPELVPQFYSHQITLFRRRQDGTHKRLSTLFGNRLITTFDGERLDAAAVVWCLHYGNWPKFPLVILDSDPFNLQLDNIYPARLKRLRYMERLEGGKYYHPLSRMGFRNERECKADWMIWAREHYTKDLGYVLQLEKEERELRKATGIPSAGRLDWERRKAASSAARTARLLKGAENRVPRPKRPPAIEGMVWHFYKKQWLSVPPAAHVSDDNRNRCEAWLRGAVRAEYQPEYQETWYFDAAGQIVKPA